MVKMMLDELEDGGKVYLVYPIIELYEKLPKLCAASADLGNASMMVVLNSKMFGIAQLDQLRGRIGHGTRPSKCISVASAASSLNRLKVLEQSSDGFYLANMDLLLWGPGDLLGKKQSGYLPEFPVARLEVDGNILQDAHVAALVIVE
ncbi:hypothetical protein JHK85_025417 [Glycine max]|nr:hypothetical protein JHK85_025417 [Glycine max]